MHTEKSQTIDQEIEVNHMLIEEINAMVKFALSRGKKVNPSVLLTLDEVKDNKPTPKQLRTLTNHHNQLVSLIHPALPQNVVYLAEREEIHANRKNIFQSKFPMLRKLLVFSILATLTLILSSLSQDVSTSELSKGVLHSSGTVLLTNFIFLSSAAAIGASFLVLSNIRNKFTNGTYHPDQNSTLWVTILLGIIGGIIMSEMVSIHPNDVSTISEDADMSFVNNKMLFALLGGFSSKLVYDVLNKLIVAVESMVSGGPESKAMAEVERTKSETELQLSRQQMNYTGQLAALKSRVQDLENTDDIKQELSSTINAMFEDIGVDTGVVPEASPAQ